jgi:hypothetical protein
VLDVTFHGVVNESASHLYVHVERLCSLPSWRHLHLEIFSFMSLKCCAMRYRSFFM